MLPLVLGFLLLVAVQCQVTFIGSKFNSASRSTTFSYSVADDVINHFVLGLQSCPEISAISTRPATSNGISIDTQSQVSGISWYGKHQVYSVTLKGHVQKGQTTYAVVLGAYKVNTGVIDGPVCSYYDDVVCNAGGPYYGKCHNHQLSVHLVGHKSVHAVSFSWDHFISHADLLSANNVASVLSFSNDACLETYRVSLTVTGHDPTDVVSCYAFIYLEDNTKPIIQNIYERDISAQPHDIPVPMLLTATDECDPNVEIKFSERRVDAGHCSYKLIRTWVAKDHCGNEATHTQVITVIDTEAPTLSGVDTDREYKCDAVPPPCTVEGNDYNDVTVVIKEFKQAGPCDCRYTLTRKWIATDCAGNSHSETQKITVTDDEAPNLYGVPSDTNAECDEIPPVPSPSASDNCCGATINFFESKLSGTCVNDYVITRSWIATDSCGNSTTRTQEITVADSEPPTISGVPAGVTVECDEIPPPCEVEAHDSCDDYLSVTFSEQTIEGTCSDTYSIKYTWSAEDLCGNIGKEEQLVGVQDFRAPTVTGLPPSALTVECDSLPKFNPRFKDNCDSTPTIEATNNLLVSTYTHDYVEVFSWLVSDRCGNSNTYSTTLTVEDNDDPVLIGVPDDIYATCESVPDVAEVEATDNCCAEYAIEPVFSSFIDPGSCPSEYVITRTWLVQDCSSNSIYGTQIVTVQDLQAPVLHGLPGYEVTKCRTPVINVTITASDNCDAVTVLDTSETIAGSCVGNYKHLNIWTAVDACGNAVSYTQTIIMYDDQPPVLSAVPFDTTVECDYSGNSLDVSAFDLCDNVTIPVVNTVTIQGTCAYDYVVYIQWTVEDDCGNSASASQTVTVQDIKPPEWVDSEWVELITEEYPTEPPAIELFAVDNCGDDPEITFSEKKLQFGYLCPKAYRLVRAWFVIDVCGNLGVPMYQHVVIDDTTSPVFVPDVIPGRTVQCDEISPPFPVHATDAYEDIVVVLQETTEFGTCNQDYDITRTWFATDSCGNTNSMSSVINVEDTTPPILHGVPDDDTVECDIPPAALVTAEDNCDGYLDVSLVLDHTTGDYDSKTYRAWQVSDNCGNEATGTQTIQVRDTKKPYFLDYQQHFTAECDNIPPVPTVTSRDECDPNPTRYYNAKEDWGTCEHERTIWRTWDVYDHVGHEAFFHQTIVVVDTTPPVLAGYASDSIAVECDQLPTHHSLTATDNCDKNVTAVWTVTDVDPFYACDDQYIRFWTWTAADDCGNSASYTKTINVDDSTPPVLYCGDRECRDYEGDFEVECEDGFLSTPLSVSASDSCDSDITPSPQHVTEHGSCNDAYLKIDSWTAVDNCGNSAYYSRSTTVVDTTPPTWTTPPNSTRRVHYKQGIHCPDDLEATDICDFDVAIKCVSDITNGICEQDYTMTCTCTAVDDCGNSAKFVQVIDVYDDEKPVIDSIASTTVECLSYLVTPSEPHVNWGYGTGKLSFTSRTVPQGCDYHVIYTWTALDDCHLKHVVDQTVVVNDEIAPVIYNVPDDLTTDCIPPAPVDYLTGEDNCDGKVLVVADYEKIDIDGPYCYTLVRTWSAVDHCGTVIIDTQTITVDDNEPPRVSYPPSHLTTDCHSLPFASEDDVSVTDNCEAHRNVTFSDDRRDGTCDCEWQNFRHWHVCDSCGNCVDVYQTVTVTDDLPPSLSLYPGDLTVQSGDVPYAADVVGYDTYGSEVDVTYTEQQVNSTYAAGSYLYLLIRVWFTQDQCQNAETKTQTITVIDTIPVPVNGVPKDVTLPCLDTTAYINGVLSVVVLDGSVATIYTTAYIQAVVETNVIASNGGAPGDIDITLDSNIVVPGECKSEYLWIRCWQTEDHSGNQDSACFTISFVDNEPPHFLVFPEVEFVECITLESELVVEVRAEDNCAAGATVVETSEDFVDDYSGFFTRTWTATDACGHTVTHTQTTWVSDTEPPEWQSLPIDATYCCNAVPDPEIMTANDTCHPNPVVTTMSWKEVVCEGEYIIFYSWRAVDVEGNWIRHEQQIQVQDCAPPVLYVGDFSSYSNSSSPVAMEEFDSAWGPGEHECPWVEEHGSLYAKDDCSDYPWNVPIYAVDRWGPDDCKNYIAFHWQTADDCGNEATYSQTITVEDRIPPVLSGCPSANETLHCGTPLNHPYVSGEDACDPFVEVLRTEDMTEGSCDYDYSVVISWSIVDRCGLTSGCEQTIVYEDAEDPVLILHAPALITAECDSPISASAVSASDDCQDYFDIDYEEVQEDGTCPCEYALHRSWTTEDNCGKVASVTQTISVVDTLPPVLSAAPKDTTAPCNHLPPWPSMTATDNCCEVTILTYHEIVTDPDCEFRSLHIRWWTASDQCGHLVKYVYTITVVDDEGPVFTLGSFVPGFLKVECDQIPDQAILVAHDECSGNVDVTLTHFNHTRDCEDSYFLFRHWVADDACGNSVTLKQTIQVDDLTPPLIVLPPADSYECDHIPDQNNHDVVATDNCDPNPHVSFQSQLLGADCSDNWSVMMVWIATDRCGNEIIYNLVVAVDDTQFPELIGVPADTTVNCDLPDVPHVTVQDDCDKHLTANFEQEIPYQLCDYSYTAIRRWSATDRCHNSVEGNQRITVVDTGPPLFSSRPDDTTIGCKDPVLPLHVTASDDCQNTVVVHVDQLVVPGSCPFQYLTIITWSAEDKCGNSISHSQTVSVHDNAPPKLGNHPDDVETPCENIPLPPVLHASDDCSYSLVVLFSESIQAGTCDNSYTIIRTWSASDECGNKDSDSQNIAVYDHTPPKLVGIFPIDATVSCSDIPLIPVFGTSDNCEGYITYSEEEYTTYGTCKNEYVLSRKFSATDLCGNKDGHDYEVTVQDNEEPVFSYMPADLTVECGDIPLQGDYEVTASDSCSADTHVWTSFDSSPSTCTHLDDLLTFHTWQAEDDCGNSDVYTQTITARDTTPPVIQEHEDITCEIGNVPPPWQCQWSDNCDPDDQTTFTATTIDGSCPHQYDIVYKCVATDCSGNVASTTHVIHVFDLTPPVILGVPADTTVEYSKFVGEAFLDMSTLVTVADNSDNQLTYVSSLGEVADVTIPGYDANDYVVIRTFTAQDDCKNYVAVHQTITVIDTTPPCFDEKPDDITVECDSIPEPCDIYTVENEDLNVELREVEGALGDSGDPCEYTISRTWRASDHSGNVATHLQIITVQDTTPPVFTRHPEDTTYECDCEGFPALANLAAIDNCDDFVAVNSDESSEEGTCPDSYLLFRDWRAQDSCGNVYYYQHRIEVSDTTPPQLSHSELSYTQDCSSPMFSAGPKFTWWDNCDDDVSKEQEVTSVTLHRNSPCSVTTNNDFFIVDNCGNSRTVSWNTSIVDDTPPSVFGSKHCVYNRTDNNLYGSSYLYAEFDIDNLVSMKDDCSEPQIIAVFFNRTYDDRYNLLSDATSDPRVPDRVYELNVSSHVQYVLIVNAMSDPDATSDPSGDVLIVNAITNVQYVTEYVSPSRIGVSSYTFHFSVDSVLRSETIHIYLKNTHGVLWQDDAVLKTQHGEGYWKRDSVSFGGEVLSCTSDVDPSTLTKPCGSVLVSDSRGEVPYVALPNFSDDRFRYASTSNPWQSLISVVDRVVDLQSLPIRWWMVTDFFKGNPSSRSLLDIEEEIAKLRVNPAFPSMYAILAELKKSGIVSNYWREVVSRSPVVEEFGSIRVTCPNPKAVTVSQCQGACYYLGFPTAVRYNVHQMNGLESGQCRCAASCVSEIATRWNRGNKRAFAIYKWVEGFYYFAPERKVRILAHTDQINGLDINMWVRVSDKCGNTALGLVEFWVAPSVDAAAKQGRTCVWSTMVDSSHIDAAAFTSDDVVRPPGVKTRSAISDWGKDNEDMDEAEFERIRKKFGEEMSNHNEDIDEAENFFSRGPFA